MLKNKRAVASGLALIGTGFLSGAILRRCSHFVTESLMNNWTERRQRIENTCHRWHRVYWIGGGSKSERSRAYRSYTWEIDGRTYEKEIAGT